MLISNDSLARAIHAYNELPPCHMLGKCDQKDITGEWFVCFLSWLDDEQGYSTEQVIRVVEKPWKYHDEFKMFLIYHFECGLPEIEVKCSKCGEINNYDEIYCGECRQNYPISKLFEAD